MHAKPMISLAVTKGIVEAIANRGGSPEPILREFGLENSNLTDSEGFISVAKLALLLEEAARATGDDFFGLHFGEGFNPKNIGPVVYVVLNSPTIGAGIENIERYLRLHNEAARWCTHREGDRAKHAALDGRERLDASGDSLHA